MILTGVAVCLVGVVIVVIAIYPMMKKVPERA
jgi:hypothetical protein